jgi:multisubunit Na+/H+ antiporter MnhG subunit
MAISAIAIWVLLAIAMASFLLTAIGLLVSRNIYNRIQFTYPAGTIGVAAIVAAVVVRKSISQAGIKAILIGLVLFWGSATLSHAIARATRVRSTGNWKPAPSEKVETVAGD